jgi:MYXO-CTERM domain-containing protein
MKQFWLALVSVLGLAATSVPAAADLQYTLAFDSAGGTISGGHDFGTVTLHQTSADVVRVTVQLNTAIAGMGFANSGAGYAVAWDMKSGVPNSVTFDASNVNNSDYSIQALNGDYKASPFTSGANGNDYNYAIDYAAANGTDSKLVFDVTRSSGLALTDFIGNPTFHFAVDIITTAGATRNVATNNDPVTVPEPRTWLLFLAGLVLLPVLQRRRKPARAA